MIRVPVIVAAILLAACTAQPSSTRMNAPSDGTAAPAASMVDQNRTLVIAVRSEATSLASKPLVGTAFNVTPTEIFNAGLAVKDEKGVARPYLIEALPLLNTDTWRVSPDGRMETTQRLKPDVVWQDGEPLTANDFIFAWQLYAIPELGVANTSPITEVAEVLAPDARTIVIRWKRPFPDAATLEGRDFQPLPRHILEAPLRDLSPEAFSAHPFWSTEYIGLGPYRLDRTEPGAFLEAAAFDRYVLGRPKISRIRVSYISDPNTVLANLLAGTVHVALSNALPFQQSTVLKREWAGRAAGGVQPSASISSPIRRTETQLHPERVAPGSRPLLDVRVRKALAHTVDKQALNDGVFDGEGVMADTPVPYPLDYFQLVDQAITKYPFDVRRAEQLMNEAGLSKGPDGFYTGPLGRFTPGINVIAGPQNESGMAIMANTWRNAGFDFTESVLPAAQARDNGFRVLFPSMASTDGGVIEMLGASGMPTADNRWNGNNRASWINPEFETLLDGWNTTLDQTARIQRMVGMAKVYSDDLPSTPVWYVLNVTAYTADVRGPHHEADEIHLWEFR